MAEARPSQQRATSSIVSWNTDDAYEYIVKVLGEAEKIPQRYDYTLGTAEVLKRLTARYGAEHGMRCVGLLRWHLGLAEDNEVFDERIWRNWRGYFARHRVGAAPCYYSYVLIKLILSGFVGSGTSYHVPGAGSDVGRR